MRLGQVKKFVQGHMVSKCWKQEGNPRVSCQHPTLSPYATGSGVSGNKQQPGKVWGKASPGRLQNTSEGSAPLSFMQDGNLHSKEFWPLEGQGTWTHLSYRWAWEEHLQLPSQNLKSLSFNIYLWGEIWGRRNMCFQSFMPSANRTNGLNWCKTYF